MPMARWAVLRRDRIVVEVSTSTNLGKISTVNSQPRLWTTDLGLTLRSRDERESDKHGYDQLMIASQAYFWSFTVRRRHMVFG